jgi:transposase
MNRDQRRSARLRLVQGMQRGEPWHVAVAASGLTVNRSTAYRLCRRVRAEGEVALEDRRHGHPLVKLQAPMLAWLEAYCRAAPTTPGPAVQAALCERFGLTVSVGYLNIIRARLGLGRPQGRPKGARRKRGLSAATR